MRKLRTPDEVVLIGGYKPIPIPEPFEVGDYVPSAEEVEKMRRAQEKRDRKAQKKK